jgi:hypothetical protein
MKSVIALLLLATTAIASPALARNASHHAVRDQSHSVYRDNRYLGSDPDPQVQFDLEREAPFRHGG